MSFQHPATRARWDDDDIEAEPTNSDAEAPAAPLDGAAESALPASAASAAGDGEESPMPDSAARWSAPQTAMLQHRLASESQELYPRSDALRRIALAIDLELRKTRPGDEPRSHADGPPTSPPMQLSSLPPLHSAPPPRRAAPRRARVALAALALGVGALFALGVSGRAPTPPRAVSMTPTPAELAEPAAPPGPAVGLSACRAEAPTPPEAPPAAAPARAAAAPRFTAVAARQFVQRQLPAPRPAEVCISLTGPIVQED
ncbi:MAG: hypothetical protein ABJE95_20545 [Byssovorax sp.]